MADLATLRAIVGDEPSDSALKLLLRDGTVEAAANRFFEASAAPAAAASTTGKRPSSAAAATPSKERRLDTWEQEEGQARGKVRFKEPSVEGLMAAVRNLRN